MNRKNYDLIVNIRRMNRLIADGNEVGRKAASDCAAVNADRDHSQEWKNRRISEIRKREQAAIRANGAKVAELSKYFKSVCEEAVKRFDYTDPNLQNGLWLISDMGKGLPVAVRDNIIERFRGDPVSLELLKVAFEKNGMSVAKIDEMRLLFSTPHRNNEIIDEMIAYATAPEGLANAQWKPGELQRLMKDFEKTFGVDTSVNPYTAEINRMMETPNLSENQRKRMEGFLSIYGEGLELDEDDSMSQAAKRIGEEFKMPLA